MRIEEPGSCINFSSVEFSRKKSSFYVVVKRDATRSLKEIQIRAFSGCQNLNIQIPKSVTSVHEDSLYSSTVVLTLEEGSTLDINEFDPQRKKESLV